MKKPRPKKNCAHAMRGFCPLTIGKIVREDFMKPLGVTVEQLKAGIAHSCPRPAELKVYLSWLLDDGPKFALAPDQILFVDVSLVLDRAFGCPAGYFMKRWSRSAIQSRARINRRWLSKIQPVGSAMR